MRLFNRFTMPADGWAHVVPKGEFPWQNPEDEKDVLIQVVDDEALAKLRANFPAELFIDKDHLSNDLTQETVAQAWGAEAAIRPDGLYVKPRWTEDGLRNVQGGNYRYISPVFDPDTVEPLGIDERSGLRRVRVTRLLEAGLTNKPNMRGKALSNRKPGGPEEMQPGSSDEDAAKNKKEPTAMKLINRALDLSPDASEEAAAGGIDKLKKQLAETSTLLANRDAELASVKTTLANREAEIGQLKATITQHEEALVDAELSTAGLKKEDAQHAPFRKALLANRETGKALLDAFVAERNRAADAEKKAADAARRAPLTNRQGARNPDDKDNKQLTGIARTQAALAAERETEEAK
jgi:phage I-like protein